MRGFSGVLALAFGLIQLPMNTSASDFLDPNAPVRARLTLGVREGQETAKASITFQSDGLQLLAPGGRVTLNDADFQPERLRKQGFQYRAQVKRSSRYVLRYALGPGKPVRTVEIADRVFVPEFPAAVPRGRGVTIPFRGPPLSPDERLFVELTGGGEGPGKWAVVLPVMLEGNRILVPVSALAGARLGPAQLYVGVTRRTSVPVDKLAVTFAAGAERTVDVTD